MLREIKAALAGTSLATGAVGDKFEHRRLGDSERDQGNWIDAADAYSKHLQTFPRDFDIWVQCGNCRKEAGEYGLSLEAYSRAISLRDNDADVYVQRGHLLKLMNRELEAIESFQTALGLDPSQSDAYREIRQLDGEAPIVVRKSGTTLPDSDTRNIHIDITDLLFFLRHNMNVTGIQRVVTNIAKELLTRDSNVKFGNLDIVFINWGDCEVLTVDSRFILNLLKVLRKPLVTREDLDKAIEQCFEMAHTANLQSGDIYLVTGAFWVSPSYERVLTDCRERGLSVGVWIYDLIPITHSNFVTEEASNYFTVGLIEIFHLSDFILTISEYVAHEVRRFMKNSFAMELPVASVTLAQELQDLRSGRSDVGGIVRDVASEPFVLCVGTIEIRKNHQYLVNLWRELIAERGDAVPNLVFVGRWGWRIADLKQQLEDTNYLDGKVILIDSANDLELSYLYKSCMFTVYPSLVEGGGLPVGESLAYGKPCIASGATSIPEVGGDFVRYIDPLDLSSGRRELHRVLDDPQDLADWTKRIAEEFKPVTWVEVAENLLRTTRDIAPESLDERRRANLHVPPGRCLAIGEDARKLVKSDVPGITALLIRIKGWHRMESWGCWSMSRTPTLRFRVDAPEGARVGVALKLSSPLPSPSASVTIRSGSLVSSVPLFPVSPKWHFVNAEVGQDGVVDLALRCVGSFPAPAGEVRQLYVGLAAFGCFIGGNLEQRVDLLQDILFQ